LPKLGAPRIEALSVRLDEEARDAGQHGPSSFLSAGDGARARSRPRSIAEEVLGHAILRSKEAHADLGDVVAALESVAMLVAYGRASSLKEALEALLYSAPVRIMLLHEAGRDRAPAPALSLTRFALAPGACRTY
jgi:hypothetical protein